MNRFYTILIVPEKTSRVRRFVIPNWLFKSAAISTALVSLIGVVMVLDYWNPQQTKEAADLDKNTINQQGT